MSPEVGRDLTPTRKRKRNSEKLEANANSCFTNAAFSSTPKKISGRRRIIPPVSKTPYCNNSCMEVKSIADLVKEQKEIPAPVLFNPYEVQRKPPKKKKREAIEEACFENPALNLNVPEKQFNPFEVVRHADDCRIEDQRKCFINEALNIKGQDSIVRVRNPFEIRRNNEMIGDHSTKASVGIENLALEDTAAPTSLKIGIPFTPTIGCRIDFNNVSLSQLTPSKLLLAEKLVFSPVASNVLKPKRSLDAISEESSSTSIGKELDRYQLELENSINEAKLLKNDGKHHNEEERVYQLQLKIEKRTSLNQRLTEIPENEEFEIEANEERNTEDITHIIEPQSEVETKRTEISSDVIDTIATVKTIDTQEVQYSAESEHDFDLEKEDEEFDFKAPTPFVRNYRRDNVASKMNLASSKESSNLNKSAKSSTECIAEKENNNISVKGFIRKSIRKIMPHHKEQAENKDAQCESQIISHEIGDETKQCTLASHIISSIRHSLRRKPKAPSDEPDKLETKIPMAEISIIDASERIMKLRSCVARNDYARIEELTNEKKHRLGNGSIRRSMMKTLFHRQEEYSFQK